MSEKLQFIANLAPLIAIIVTVGVAGWVVTTWMRIKHGYPLETSWGVPVHPSSDKEALERIKLLTSENAQLRAEIGSVKDRLATVERIVTDGGIHTAAQIEALREPRLVQGEKVQ
jgi:hypothetical protein